MLFMFKYYEYKDYSWIWVLKEVEIVWVEVWFVFYDDFNIVDLLKCFEIECFSMLDFCEVLGIYFVYFFIFLVKIFECCLCVF